MVLVKSSLCERFGEDLGMQLSEITDRLVYLLEVNNKTLCEESSCNHSSPDFKVLIYECMKKKQDQWNE